jgi:spore maturation protein SpmA
MTNRPARVSASVAPTLVPGHFVGMLQDVDELLALMARESLDVVAELANALSLSAQGTGAWEIAETAGVVQRVASGHRPASPAGPMRALTTAVERARRQYQLEH